MRALSAAVMVAVLAIGDSGGPRRTVASRAPRARLRCGCPWCRHTRPASPRTASTARRSAFGSCAPPDQASAGLTVGTPDANGEASRLAGFVRLATIVGDPDLAGDQADVSVVLAANDVRLASDLSDYTGELDLRPTFRLTDLDNGPDGDAATVLDFQLSFRATCSATAETTAGADCNLATTADSVYPA